MDRPQWPQETVVKPMEEIVAPNTTNSNNNNNNNPSKPSSSSSSFERKIRPQKAAAHVNCPRCDSTNTKFCYYNNYSLSQPRYFCKTCRRYWTEGGTLRNIPVGGGSRKNKRSSSSSSSLSSSSYHSSVSKKLPHDLFVPAASTSVLPQNPRIHHHGHEHYGQDLNLGFPLSTNNFKNVSEFLQVPNLASTTTGSAQFSALELLNGITTRGGSSDGSGSGSSTMNSFMPIPIPIPDQNSVYAQGQLMIPMPEFKIPSSIGFSLDGMNANGGLQESNATGGRLLFPFEELKANTETTHDDDDHGGQNRDDDRNGDSNGFWNGMLGGGSW